MTSLEIKGFIETSFLDWDGKVVSTIFVPFCNFRCPFCHNSGLIENPQNYKTIPIVQIEKFLVERKDFLDGICITGGEPLLHKDRGLFEFMQHIKHLGFKIKFDTNGTDPKALKKIVDDKLIDYIAMDVKGPLDERYDKLSGVKTDLKNIKQSIKIILKSGIAYEFRTSVVPTLLDTTDIIDIAKSIAGAEKFVLQQFVPENTWDKSLSAVRPYSKEKLEEISEAVKRYIPNTLIRGV